MPLVESISGIRGVFGKELTEDVTRRYAYCFYNFLKNECKKEPKIVLGTDPRKSSQKMKEAVLDVFNHITDVGISTLPITEFSVRKFKANGGIMITASHNGPKFNGLKFMTGSGALLRPFEIKQVIKDFHKVMDLSEINFLKHHLFKESSSNSKSKLLKVHHTETRHNDSIYYYTRYLKEFITSKEISLLKKIAPKIILDPNGGSGILAEGILKSFGVRVKSINNRYGKFKRQIEPNEESLKYLKQYIKKYQAIFAAGFDCDADRVEIVLKDGSVVNGNYLLAMVVDDVLENSRFPEQVNIVVSDATSTLVKKVVERYKAKVIESEVGEINVLDKMLEYEAHVGGEGTSSGVIIPPNRCRDGIVTLLTILKMLANRNTTVEKVISGYPKYYSAMAKVKYNLRKHDSIKNKLKQFYLGKGFKIQETGDITGGLKIWIDKDNFVWYRASKTEGNYFRIVSDAITKTDSLKLMREARKVFNKFK